MIDRIIKILLIMGILLFEPTFSFGENAVHLPQTGQRVIYVTGDDGDIRAGVEWPTPRFTDNGDGTVTDHLTGLMWLKDVNCFLASRYWQSALNTIADLNANPTNYDCVDYDENNPPYSDWRLPNILELESLAHAGYNEEDCGGSPCLRLDDWLESQGFVNVAPGNTNYYWSSTTSKDSSEYAWRFLMMDGTMSGYIKTSQLFVLPLRAETNFALAELWKTGQTAIYGPGDDGYFRAGVAWPTPRFTDNGDGTVTDHLTWLTWLKDANCIQTQYPGFDNNAIAGDGKVTWQKAIDFVAGINNGTYSDCGAGQTHWRLPNRKELLSLVDFSLHYGSALPPGHPFLNVEWSEYWSSTSAFYQGSTVYAWFNYMHDGAIYRNIKASTSYVWPVRSGPVIDNVEFDECVSELSTADISVTAHDPGGGGLTYSCEALDDGDIIGEGPHFVFDPPDTGPHPCPYEVKVTVTSDVTGLSTSRIIYIYVTLTGDFGQDGDVDGSDLAMFAADFGRTDCGSGPPCEGDFDDDGDVDGSDLAKFAVPFGRTDGCICR